MCTLGQVFTLVPVSPQLTSSNRKDNKLRTQSAVFDIISKVHAYSEPSQLCLTYYQRCMCTCGQVFTLVPSLPITHLYTQEVWLDSEPSQLCLTYYQRCMYTYGQVYTLVHSLPLTHLYIQEVWLDSEPS